MAGKNKRFSLNDISGMELSAGNASLLNKISESNKNESQKTVFIPYNLLEPSELNKDMSKNNIEELASQIDIDGLNQPLVVYQKPEGTYEVLGGGRRHLAIGMLISDGRWPKDKPVECKVKQFNSPGDPLSIDDHRTLTWLITNQYREKTDSDKYIEATMWKEKILELRKKNIEILVAGYDEQGNEIGVQIKRRKTREIVAEQTNMSPGQIENILSIEKNGTDNLKEALINNKINIAGAATAAKMSPEEQDKLIQQTMQTKGSESKITSADIDTFKEKHVSTSGCTLTRNQLEKDLQNLNLLFANFNDIHLSDRDYKFYNKAIKKFRQWLSNT